MLGLWNDYYIVSEEDIAHCVTIGDMLHSKCPYFAKKEKKKWMNCKHLYHVYLLFLYKMDYESDKVFH